MVILAGNVDPGDSIHGSLKVLTHYGRELIAEPVLYLNNIIYPRANESDDLLLISVEWCPVDIPPCSQFENGGVLLLFVCCLDTTQYLLGTYLLLLVQQIQAHWYAAFPCSLSPFHFHTPISVSLSYKSNDKSVFP